MLRGVVPTVALAMTPLALVESAGAQTGNAAPLAQIIRQCVQSKWKIPADGKGEQLPAIKVRLRFKPDGTLVTAPVIANPQSSPFSSRHPAASQLRCRRARHPPAPAQYELWKDIVLTFDPRDVASVSGPTTVSPSERSEGMLLRPPGITHSAENDELPRGNSSHAENNAEVR